MPSPEYSEEGTCPECSSQNIDYGDLVREEGMQWSYSAECEDCHCRFKEYYSLVFTYQEIESGS